ncbi:MAG: L,D-transpeptidase family protein [Myxococcales bacterium]|nr:L,D-transpeptidase family protein [Myxococcales bacterium]
MTRIAALLLVVACAGSPSRTAEPARDLDVARQPHEVAPGSAPPAAPAEPPPVGEPAPPPPPATSTTPAAKPTPPAAPDAATIAHLKWPAGTASFVLRSSAHVYASPDEKSEPLGKIIAGTRLPVGAFLEGDKRCKVWLAAAPRGWVCGRYVGPSTLAPEAIVQPELPRGKLLPNEYYGVKEGAKRYATEDDVRAGIAKPEPKSKSTYMVTKDKTVEIDGVVYAKTTVGLIAVADLYRHWPSTFAGIDLVASPPPAWPFAWVIAKNKKDVAARATPNKKGAPAGTLAHRAIVPVLEESGDYVRVGEGQWVERAAVRIARKRPRPPVADAPPKWIDLDRDEQVLVAYDGETPVFATLVSSGIRKTDTPTALYRIRSKTSVQKMAAEEREASHYTVEEVPWATRFRSGLYFHAAYWHDGFGNRKSHGCVNLSPKDAKWVYDWTEPTMPEGWNELEVPESGSVVVQIRDEKNPEPKPFDYVKEAKERVKIRKLEAELKKKREAAEAEAAAAAGTAPAPAVPAPTGTVPAPAGTVPAPAAATP